jgi:hypothetical protein
MNIKKIIKETIDDFDWAGGIPETPSMDKQLHLGATFMVRDYNMRLKVDFVDSDVVYLTIISSDVEGEPIGEELEMTIVECMDLLKSGYWGYEVQNSMNESDDFDWVSEIPATIEYNFHEIHFYFGDEDSHSVYMKIPTELNLQSDDEITTHAVNINLISDGDVDSIDYVDEIDKSEYCDMWGMWRDDEKVFCGKPMNESDDFDWVDQSGVETPFSWLINNFGNLTPIVMGDKTFYVDDNSKKIFYYNQDEEDGDCHIDYNEIWLVLRTHFGFKYDEIEKITTRWLDEVYGITGRIPLSHFF